MTTPTSPITPPNPSEMAATRAEEVYLLLQGQDEVLQDVDRWRQVHSKFQDTPESAFLRFWSSRQEFRSVIQYRVRNRRDGTLAAKFGALCAGKPWFFVSNLFLSCKDIGPGLYVEHGFSTVVWARRIGANFHVNQNVTVGNRKGGQPTLGDQVSIHAGAIVLGGITLGDHVRVGAGAVVVDDIPSHATVVPQKSRVILAPGHPR